MYDKKTDEKKEVKMAKGAKYERKFKENIVRYRLGTCQTFLLEGSQTVIPLSKHGSPLPEISKCANRGGMILAIR